MNSIGLAEAKARLDALIDRVAAGETVAITRRGKEIAILSPPERRLKRVDVEALRAVSDSTPLQSESAGEFVRRMRDEDRYRAFAWTRPFLSPGSRDVQFGRA